MERIGRNCFLNADNHFQNRGMKSLSSSDQLDHFECNLMLEFEFSS